MNAAMINTKEKKIATKYLKAKFSHLLRHVMWLGLEMLPIKDDLNNNKKKMNSLVNETSVENNTVRNTNELNEVITNEIQNESKFDSEVQSMNIESTSSAAAIAMDIDIETFPNENILHQITINESKTGNYFY